MNALRRWLLLLPLTAGGPWLPGNAASVAQMLPESTLVTWIVPNATDTRRSLADHAWHRIWNDPALLPFRENLVTNVQAMLSTDPSDPPPPLGDILDLAEGSVALALAQGEGGKGSLDLHPLILAEVGSHGDQALELLARIGRPGADAPAPVILRGAEFRAVALQWPPRGFLLPAGPRQQRITVWAGVTNTWFLLGSDTNHLAGALDRLTGPPAGGLTSLPLFAADSPVRLAGRTAYGWINLQPLLHLLERLADEADQNRPADEVIPLPKRRQMLEATGLLALESASLALTETPAGTRLELSARAPASQRKGVIQMLELSPRDASPPADIPAGVLRFERLRPDFPRIWGALEQMMTDVFPQTRSVMELLFQTVGPDGQAGDLRTNLLAVLGNDVVTCEFPHTGQQLDQLASPPTIVRLASTNPAALAFSLKALTVLLPPPATELKEERVNGLDISRLRLPHWDLRGDAISNLPVVHFAATDQAVVFASERSLLLAELQNTAPPDLPLRSLAGLSEAAAEIGGMGQGMFGYANLAESMRWTVNTLRSTPNAWQELSRLAPLATLLPLPIEQLQNLVDFRLLPPFDAIAPYFHFAVYSAGSDSQRLYHRMFFPRPPK